MMRRYDTGITLIELMVVVVIVSILTSIAYPSYRQYAIRANRTEAKTMLLEQTQALEKCYTRYHVYSHVDCDAADELADPGITSPSGNYQIMGVIALQSYTLTATPALGQAADTKCTTLAVDHTGKRFERIDQTPVPANKCW